MDEYGGVRPESDRELRSFMRDPSYLHFVGMLDPPRPGVHLCAVKLEHMHYPPKSIRNQLFFLRVMEWSDIAWLIISIPIGERNLMESVASECGLRIADGVPTMLGSRGSQIFPISNERVFTLENAKGHPAYGNDPEELRVVIENERQAIRRILGGSHS